CLLPPRAFHLLARRPPRALGFLDPRLHHGGHLFGGLLRPAPEVLEAVFDLLLLLRVLHLFHQALALFLELLAGAFDLVARALQEGLQLRFPFFGLWHGAPSYYAPCASFSTSPSCRGSAATSP